MSYKEMNNVKLESGLIKMETLQKEYEVTLRQYQEAGKNYINSIQNVSSNPCHSYTSDSRGISQQCYNKIWKDQGCITQPQDVNSPYPKAQTLDGLVYDSYLWATMDTKIHREGCYGTSKTFTTNTAPIYPNPTKYYIIGVGTDGYLYVKQSLGGGDTWRQVKDNSSGNVKTICTGIDGRTIYGTNRNNDMIYKPSWNSPTWAYHSSYGKGKFKAVAACPDGTLLGIGLDNTLYQIRSNGSFTSVKQNGESAIGVTVAPDGSVFVCNGAGNVYKKNSYQNLQNQSWQGLNGGCCIKAMTIPSNGMFIGVGTDNRLYTKPSYTSLSTAWTGPYTSSCCVVSITTVPNPNYTNVSKFTSLKGRTWWGTGPDKEGAATTQEDCEDMCSSSGKCTGATFNPVKRYCWTRTGDGNISAGLGTDYALIPKQKAALIVMKNLNDALLALNVQITNELKNITPAVEKQIQERDLKQQQLNDTYKRLLEQKIEMENRLQEYYSIEQEGENQTLYANQQSGSMRGWMLIACLVLLIALIKIFGFNNPSSAFMIWLLIFMVLLVLTFSLSSPSGFAMWLIVLTSIILMKSGYLYSP